MRVDGLYIDFIYYVDAIDCILVNTVDTGQIVAFHLGLSCLPNYLFNDHSKRS